MSTLTLFAALIVGHCVCDYPLQSAFMAVAKSHRDPIPGTPWYQILGAHAVIHGGAVALITTSPLLGLAETFVHAGIDYLKCDGKTTLNQDQALHWLCKLVWAVLAVHFYG